MLGTPASGDLYYTSNGGSLFAMRVDIEVDFLAMRSPLFVAEESEDDFEISQEDNQLSLVPNPAREEVLVRLKDGNIKSKYFIKVVGVDGRVVFDGELMDGKLSIDCRNFSSGLYTVWVWNDNNTLL